MRPSSHEPHTVGEFLRLDAHGRDCRAANGVRHVERDRTVRFDIGNREFETVALVVRLSSYADVARRDGVLALESKLADEDDELVKKGLQLLSDGVELDEVKKQLQGVNDSVSSATNTSFNPIQTIRDELKTSIEAPVSAPPEKASETETVQEVDE